MKSIHFVVVIFVANLLFWMTVFIVDIGRREKDDRDLIVGLTQNEDLMRQILELQRKEQK